MTLEIVGLGKSYGDVEALKSLDFQLESGRCVALLGPNGAGKSTAIKIMVTLLTPDRGQFLLNGTDLLPTPKQIRAAVGYVSQEMAMDKMLTGAEFMRFCAGILHLKWKDHEQRAMGILDQMGLSEARDRKVGDYSGGMKRRLDLATALLNEPKILVLDEPTTGLDLEARELIWGLLRDYLDGGGSIILASHDFREVSELADEVLVMDSGRVIHKGEPAELKRQLADFIVSIKTDEIMTTAAREQVRQAFAAWSDIEFKEDEEQATFSWRGSEKLNELQARVYEQMEAAKLAVFSLNIRRPDLEDVYRYALGGAQ